MSKVDQSVNCGAWVDLSTAQGRRRVCTLAAGHYTGPGSSEDIRMHGIRDDESWHTDCPAVAGLTMAMHEHDHEHPNLPSGSCMVWADAADGAHPSDVTLNVCVRCPHPPALHRGPDTCRGDRGGCTCELSEFESTDPGWAQATGPELTVKESGRTLGTNITGGYRADVKIGDTGLSVYGSARFVANVVRTFADAFEEEAER